MAISLKGRIKVLRSASIIFLDASVIGLPIFAASFSISATAMLKTPASNASND